MAPQKRRRDGDGDIIAVESARSSLRQEGGVSTHSSTLSTKSLKADTAVQQRKKVRLSQPKSRNGRGESVSSDSSDDDESLPDAPAEDDDCPAPTQYETQRDGNWEHLQNEAHDDEIADRQRKSRKQQIGDNHAADNAIIRDITCINFMCHAKLHVELGPLINFVVGMNGSGKSAVLSAITLCLAGKTGSTDRGTSMKSFVKSGEERGLLIIKLKNEGPDAYQPEVFGETIIVERHFSITGTSGYRLKSAQGNVISTKKCDIDDIVEYFQLQVDNPMTVLTQDKAKSFLTKSTPAQKYTFFVEGVQLHILDRDYKMVSEYCDILEAKLSGWEQSRKVQKKKAEAAKLKSDMVQKHEGTRREARRLANQLAWIQVEAQEKLLEEKENLVLQAQADIIEREQAAEDRGIALQKADEKLEQATEAERIVQEEARPLDVELEVARSAHDAATAELSKHQKTREQIRNALLASKQKVKTIITDIEAEDKRLEDINGGSHARKKAELERAKQLAADAKDALAESQQELPRLEQEHTTLHEALIKMDSAMRAKRREVDEARARLDDVNKNRQDVMAGFDRNMSRLIQAVREDNGFREKPVGPMGLHIRLLKPEWSGIIEKTIGGNLGGFVVTSKTDQLRLSNLVRRSGFHKGIPILIGNNHAFSVAGNEPDPKFDTILRVLEIDNDLIKRQLIIAHRIEQTILIKDLTDAEKAMYESGGRPHHVSQCLAMHNTRRGWGHRLAHGGRSGQDRDLTPIQEYNGRPRMQTTIESQRQTCLANLDHAREECSRLEPQLRQAQQEVKRAEGAINRHKNTIKVLRIDSQRADEKVETLQIELDREVIEDGRLELLRDDLKEAKQNVEIDEETYGNTALERTKLNELSLDKKRALDAIKARKIDYDAKLNKASIKIRNTQQARDLLLKEKNAAIIRVGEVQEAKRHVEGRRDKMIETVAKFTADATKICTRVRIDPGENYASLEIKARKLKKQLETYAAQLGGSDEDIQNAAAEAIQAYENAVRSFTDIKQLVDQLKQAFSMRIGMFRRFQRLISARSRINFLYLLTERAFRGKLSIDHKSKKLDVHVEPDETKKSGRGRQTKTLSGGEKSFSNICLLLSLWEAMGQPLRCLDEFDVFMDDVNRDVSTGMIVSVFNLLRLTAYTVLD